MEMQLFSETRAYLFRNLCLIEAVIHAQELHVICVRRSIQPSTASVIFLVPSLHVTVKRHDHA